MSEEERSLGDVLQVDESAIVDSSVTPVPEDFDLDAWLDGVRPTRRSVKLYPNAHLVARLEEIADRIDNTPDGENVDALIDEFEQVKAQLQSGVWFTVEKRSSEWVAQFQKDLAKRLNLDLSRKGDGTAKNPKDSTTVSLHQLAAQIVSPEGVTYNHLRKLVDHNEGEAIKLLNAMESANNTLAEGAGVLDRDFSERRSASTPD